jgi:GTP cyclohydrolase I
VSRFSDLLAAIRTGLEARSAFGSVKFPYFIEKKAPVSLLPGMMSYRCRYQGRTDRGGKTRVKASVAVPVATVCPCSKALSDRGAHNQRGVVRVEVEPGPSFWIEDIIGLVEQAASSPVYSLLKREDEKYITELAYDNPKFVEDLVRDVYIQIKGLGKFPRFSVEAESFESIHNHNAFAYTSYEGRGAEP